MNEDQIIRNIERWIRNPPNNLIGFIIDAIILSLPISQRDGEYVLKLAKDNLSISTESSPCTTYLVYALLALASSRHEI